MNLQRFVPNHSVLFTATMAACLNLAGCQGKNPPPDGLTEGSLPPLAITLQVTYRDEPSIRDRPENITGHLYLNVAADSTISGTMSATWGNRETIDVVMGSVENDDILFAPGDVAVSPGGSIAWDAFGLTVTDEDGDGVVDSGTGTADGTWTAVGGDVVEQAAFTAEVSAQLDITEGVVWISPNGRVGDTFVPSDSVLVEFSEPVPQSTVADRFHILTKMEAPYAVNCRRGR